MKTDKLQAKLKETIRQHKAGDFLFAQQGYEELLMQAPERTDILYNLGLVFISLNNPEKAQVYFEKVLKIKEDHFDALSNLGALLLKQEKYAQALQCFSAVIYAKPDHLEARNNLATTLLQLGRYAHASQHYQILLEKIPEDISVQYSYGLSLLEMGCFNEAIVIFEKILLYHPEHLNAQSNLGIAYLKSGASDKAKNIFKNILTQHPDQPEIQYLYAAITNDSVPDKPPEIYIQRLFDHYACYYDSHMTTVLDYTVPAELFSLFKQYRPAEEGFHILDMGCGTGLSGQAFKPIAKSLDGVDLSHKMLNKARQKKIYDTLTQADIIDYLCLNKHRYDMLLACDTFNYFGNLSWLFTACYQALDPVTDARQKFLLFSIENCPDALLKKDFHLRPNGRYVHDQSYIEKIAKDNHFYIYSIQRRLLRQENHQPVEGLLCLMGLHRFSQTS